MDPGLSTKKTKVGFRLRTLPFKDTFSEPTNQSTNVVDEHRDDLGMHCGHHKKYLDVYNVFIQGYPPFCSETVVISF